MGFQCEKCLLHFQSKNRLHHHLRKSHSETRSLVHDVELTPDELRRMLMIQNGLLLIQALGLPVSYDLYAADDEFTTHGRKSFYVIVHVRSDHAFKTYVKNATPSDMQLFRGLVLKVTAQIDDEPDVEPTIIQANIQQAFYPKFENDKQTDISDRIATTIVAEAGEKPMTISVKHSGSLGTMSATLFAAKNSLGNAFSAAGMVLLEAHYMRICNGNRKEATKLLDRLIATMKKERLSIGMEAVTRCHGHHGQLPEGEYFCVTSVHKEDSEKVVSFWSLSRVLQFCVDMQLPSNDTWIVSSPASAAKVRLLLDKIASSAMTTETAIEALTSEVESQGGIYLPGTYRHSIWQGSRQEGFVVAQGEQLSEDLRNKLFGLKSTIQAMEETLTALATNSDTPRYLITPFEDLVRKQISNSNGIPAMRLSTIVNKFSPKDVVAFVEDSRLSENTPRVAVGDKLSKEFAERIVSSIRNWIPLAPEYPTSVISRMKLQATPLKQLQEAYPEIKSATGAMQTEFVEFRRMVPIIQTIGGAVSTAAPVLMYKKKFVGYNLETRNVAYCMLTFVIRNGLSILQKKGMDAYMSYVNNLVNNWKASADLGTKMITFASAWAHYTESLPYRVSDSCYLEDAEEFIKQFLTSSHASKERAEDAFQGIIFLVNPPPNFQDEIVQAMDIRRTPAIAILNKTGPASVIHQEGVAVTLSLSHPKRLSTDLKNSVWPFSYVLSWPVNKEDDDGSDDFKKQCGVYNNYFEDLTTKWFGTVLQKQMNESEERYNSRCQKLLQRHVRVMDRADTTTMAAAWIKDQQTLTRNTEDDQTIAVTMITMPGVGKSTILSGLHEATESIPASWKLFCHHGDEIAGKYWKLVSTSRYDDPHSNDIEEQHTRIVLCDKNLVPSPQGHIANIGRTLNYAGMQTVAVVPRSSGDSYGDRGVSHPFSPAFIALCMLRVLDRQEHLSSPNSPLTGRESETAVSIVCMFSSFFPSIHRESFIDIVEDSMDHVIEIDFLDEGACKLSDDLKDKIRTGVRKIQKNRSKFDPSQPEWQQWEAEMRQLLSQHRSMLTDAAYGIDEIRCQILRELKQFAESTSMNSVSPSSLAALGYISMSEPLSGQSDDSEAVESAWKREFFMATKEAGVSVIENIESVRSNLHVTLWHKDNDFASNELPTFLSSLGNKYAITIDAIDVSPEVVAAHVVSVVGDHSSPPLPEYPHITLYTAEGIPPVASKLLPKRLKDADPTVTRITLSTPLVIQSEIVCNYYERKPTTSATETSETSEQEKVISVSDVETCMRVLGLAASLSATVQVDYSQCDNFPLKEIEDVVVDMVLGSTTCNEGEPRFTFLPNDVDQARSLSSPSSLDHKQFFSLTAALTKPLVVSATAAGDFDVTFDALASAFTAYSCILGSPLTAHVANSAMSLLRVRVPVRDRQPVLLLEQGYVHGVRVTISATHSLFDRMGELSEATVAKLQSIPKLSSLSPATFQVNQLIVPHSDSSARKVAISAVVTTSTGLLITAWSKSNDGNQLSQLSTDVASQLRRALHQEVCADNNILPYLVPLLACSEAPVNAIRCGSPLPSEVQEVIAIVEAMDPTLKFSITRCGGENSLILCCCRTKSTST